MNTRKSITQVLLLIPVFLLLVLPSCKHNDLEIEKENENFRLATDFVKNNYEMTLFSAAIEKVGLADKLRENGPFTLLVPNDAAFREMGINRPSDFSKMNQDSLKGLVERHILTRRLLFSDMPHNGVDVRYKTMAGTEVYASMAGYRPGGEAFAVNDLYFNGSPVTRKDVTLANGVLHMLNKVMKYTPKITIQTWLSARPKYSIFIAGLKKFGFWDQLAAAGSFTVFAPDNQGLEAAGITEASIAEMDAQQYFGTRLFGGYILPGTHFFLSDFEVFKTNNGQEFLAKKIDNDTWFSYVSTTRNFFTKVVTGGVGLRTAPSYPNEIYGYAGAKVPALSDHLFDNGVLHEVKGVLLLPEQALKK